MRYLVPLELCRLIESKVFAFLCNLLEYLILPIYLKMILHFISPYSIIISFNISKYYLKDVHSNCLCVW